MSKVIGVIIGFILSIVDSFAHLLCSVSALTIEKVLILLQFVVIVVIILGLRLAVSSCILGLPIITCALTCVGSLH